MPLKFDKLMVLGVMLLGATGAGVVPAPDTAGQMLAHRAYYKMTLDSAKNDSEVKAADGLMVFEWQDACDGWIVQQKLDVQITHAEEERGVRLVTNYATWEAKDGLSYNFTYRTTANGNPFENFRGSAKLNGVGQAGVANYTLPEEQEVKLPAGTLFPTAHTIALINAAQSEQKFFTATVFDGSDAVGMSQISAVIGGEKPLSTELAKQGVRGAATAWPVRMAFFGMKNADNAEPDYEMDTNMLPNGVSEYMLTDFGKYRLRGTLEKFEVLPKPHC